MFVLRTSGLALFAAYFLALWGCASSPTAAHLAEQDNWARMPAVENGAWPGTAVTGESAANPAHPRSYWAAASAATQSPAPGTWPAGSQLPVGSFATSNPVLASFRHAASAVGNSFQIQPKVTPAYDPVSLSANPGQVGGDLYLQAAKVFESQGNLNSALAHYEKALAQSPESPAVLVSYARLFDRQGEYSRAESLYQRATAAAPEDPTAFNDLGVCLLRRGAAQAAVGPLARASELQPLNKLYRNNLAAALVQLGRAEDAYRQLTVVHGEAIAHYNLGCLLWKTQRPEEARQQFQAALAIDPSLRPAQQLLAQLSQSPSSIVPTVPATEPRADEWGPADRYPLPATRSAVARPGEIRTLPPI